VRLLRHLALDRAARQASIHPEPGSGQAKGRGAVTKDTKTTENTTDEPISEAPDGGETAYEAFMKAIAGDPQFQPAKPSGKAFVVGAAKPHAMEN